MSERLQVGQRVVVRTAYNELRNGIVARVPRDWRDNTGSDAETTRGDFPKAWVTIVGKKRETVPWPLTAVFTDIDAANAAVAAGGFSTKGETQ